MGVPARKQKKNSASSYYPLFFRADNDFFESPGKDMKGPINAVHGSDRSLAEIKHFKFLSCNFVPFLATRPYLAGQPIHWSL